MTCLRTRQDHWKPTTDFAQRFGCHASACVIYRRERPGKTLLAGEDQDLEWWDGEWGT